MAFGLRPDPVLDILFFLGILALGLLLSCLQDPDLTAWIKERKELVGFGLIISFVYTVCFLWG